MCLWWFSWLWGSKNIRNLVVIGVVEKKYYRNAVVVVRNAVVMVVPVEGEHYTNAIVVVFSVEGQH